MADLEDLVSKLPNLADSMNLTIGRASEIRREISRITNIQKQLAAIKTNLQKALDDERFNKGFLGSIPVLGRVASIFIPGGDFVCAILGEGSNILAEKLGDPDKETSIVDLIQNIGELIGWGEWLKKIAEDILNNSIVLDRIEQLRTLPNLVTQAAQVDTTLKIYLEFGDSKVLKQQINEIETAQAQLKCIQSRLDTVIETLEKDVEPVECIKSLLFYFGESVFTIEWFDDEEGLIISYADKVISLSGILSKCESLKTRTDDLIIQSNNLRGQAQQSVQLLEKSATYRREELAQPISQSNKFPFKPLLAVSILGFIGYWGWKNGFQLPQLTNNESVPVASSAPIVKPVDQAAANLETAKKLALEAAVITQNPPHPLTVWQQSIYKWQQAIKLLESIPDNSSVSGQAKEKLATYRTSYAAINNRIITEQKAAANLEVAKKLAWEVAVMIQKPPHPKEVWKNAQLKLQLAISVLEEIPQGSFVAAEAKEKLASYRNNYTVISKKS